MDLEELFLVLRKDAGPRCADDHLLCGGREVCARDWSLLCGLRSQAALEEGAGRGVRQGFVGVQRQVGGTGGGLRSF